MLAKPSPLALAITVSAGLHAGLVAWPGLGDGALAQSGPARPLFVKAAKLDLYDDVPAPAQRSERADRREKILPRPVKYYTSKEVDVTATPQELKNAVRTGDNFPLGRIATVKLKLFINEHGIVDRYEILEADQLPDEKLLNDFRAVVFRPAELGGRPVKSQKIVGLSFVP